MSLRQKLIDLIKQEATKSGPEPSVQLLESYFLHEMCGCMGLCFFDTQEIIISMQQIRSTMKMVGGSEDSWTNFVILHEGRHAQQRNKKVEQNDDALKYWQEVDANNWALTKMDDLGLRIDPQVQALADWYELMYKFVIKEGEVPPSFNIFCAERVNDYENLSA